MIYNYKCPNCGKEQQIDKPMRESGHPERCDNCEFIMDRVYNAPSIKTADGNKGQIREFHSDGYN